MSNEKKVFVRTTYTECEYITPNKLYELRYKLCDDTGKIIGGSIDADTGESIILHLSACSHIDNNAWEIVYV